MQAEEATRQMLSFFDGVFLAARFFFISSALSEDVSLLIFPRVGLFSPGRLNSSIPSLIEFSLLTQIRLELLPLGETQVTLSLCRVLSPGTPLCGHSRAAGPTQGMERSLRWAWHCPRPCSPISCYCLQSTGLPVHTGVDRVFHFRFI